MNGMTIIKEICIRFFILKLWSKQCGGNFEKLEKTVDWSQAWSNSTHLMLTMSTTSTFLKMNKNNEVVWLLWGNLRVFLPIIFNRQIKRNFDSHRKLCSLYKYYIRLVMKSILCWICFAMLKISLQFWLRISCPSS